MTTNTTGTLPLQGLRVLDVTAALAGPQTTFLLGALGAEVIKVEAPGGSDMGRLNPPYVCKLGIHFDGPLHDDDVSVSALSRLRNKRSVTIDGKSVEGRALLQELAASCDIVVHNIRAESILGLGVDYESLQSRNPELIYCAISAFGADSTHGDVGMDIMVQALSGLMAVTGEEDGPPMRVGLPIADFVAPLYACFAILGALRLRDQGMGGRKVEVSMLDALTSLVASEHFDVLEQFGMPIRTGNSLARMGPFGCYRTSDGYVAIAASQDRWCHQLYRAMGRPDLIENPLLGTRGARASNAKLVDSTIEEWTTLLTSDAVVKQLTAHGVPAAEVRDPRSALADEGVVARGGVVPLVFPPTGQEVGLTGGVPFRFSDVDVVIEPVHSLGADTFDVLSAIGVTDAHLERLRTEGVI